MTDRSNERISAPQALQAVAKIPDAVQRTPEIDVGPVDASGKTIRFPATAEIRKVRIPITARQPRKGIHAVLSYRQGFGVLCSFWQRFPPKSCFGGAPQEGIEPPTYGSEDRRSSPLSYWGESPGEPSVYHRDRSLPGETRWYTWGGGPRRPLCRRECARVIRSGIRRDRPGTDSLS
jgi:hypothetical protein